MSTDLEDRKIYDDNEPAWRTNLEDDTSESEPGAKTETKNNKVASPSDLKEQEEVGASTQADSNDEESAFNYNPGNRRATGSVVNKKVAVGFIASGGGILIVVLIFLAFLGNSKVINVAENITVWNMARTARNYRLSASQTLAANVETTSIDDARFAAMRGRWSESSVKSAIDRMNRLRPEKVYKNLNSDIKPVFEQGEARKLLPGNKLIFKGYEIKGTLVEPTDTKWYKPIEGYKDKLRFAAETDAILESELKGTNTLVRGKVLQRFLSERGIKLRWWEKKGSLYKGLKKEAAEYLTQKQAFEKSTRPDLSRCAVKDTCDAAKTAIDGTSERLSGTADDAANAGKNATKITDDVATIAVNAAEKSPGLTTAVSYTSAVYGIALPLCLIFDGSIENSGKTIDTKETSMMQSYMMVRSAADQQKAGDTTSEAIAGLSGKLGETTESVPLRRASGQTVDSVGEVNASSLPQSSGTGTYSLLNVFLGQFLPPEVIDTATSASSASCKVVTDVRTGVGLTVAELGLAIFSGGSSKGLTAAAQGGVKELSAYILERTVSKVGLKRFEEVVAERGLVLATRFAIRNVANSGGRVFLKLGLQTAGTLGATELAKMLVINYANSDRNGLETDEAIANQADMGGNLVAQETNRKVMYGRPMTQEEVSQSNISDLAYLEEKDKSMNINDRYFAISNPRSLMSKVAFSTSSLTESNSNVSDSITNFASMLSKQPLAIVGSMWGAQSKVKAATVTGAGEYNIVQWGWDENEEAIIANNPDYFPVENALILEQTGNAAKIEEVYGPCFTETMGELLASGKIIRETDGKIVSNQGLCSTDNLGINNKDYGDMVFRWRLSKRNGNVLDHLIDLQNADSVAANSEADSTGGSVAGDSSSSTCEAGTDAGIADGYDDNKLYKIRLCNVQGITVNAQISKNLDNLINAARAGGVQLSGGGFRDMNGQIAARRSNCGTSDFDIYEKKAKLCNPDTARPGYSNHQMGLAIDFGRCGSRSTACYVWLNANAATYGLKNLPSESWHWSVNGK